MKYIIAIAIVYLIYRFFQFRNRIEQESRNNSVEDDGYTDYEELE